MKAVNVAMDVIDDARNGDRFVEEELNVLAQEVWQIGLRPTLAKYMATTDELTSTVVGVVIQLNIINEAAA